MRQLNLYLFIFFIPGLLLSVTCIYVPISFLYKQIFWTHTEGLIGDRIENYTPNGIIFHSITYQDAQGIMRNVQADLDDDYQEGADSNHVQLLYNPANPEDFELVNYGRYLIFVFLPFGLFLMYVGWPEKIPRPKK